MSLGQHNIGAAQLRPFLEKCGYHDGLLASNIQLTGGRTASLVGFSSLNHDSRTACIAVTEITTTPEDDVIACRNVGAPIVFAYSKRYVQFWQQGATKPKLLEPPIPIEQLPQFFERERTRLSPQAVYRAKTWARVDSAYQLSFVDLGLMPLVEEEIGQKLAELIERAIHTVKLRLGWTDISGAQGDWLIKTNFWLLAAKILKDKDVPDFAGLDLENIGEVFSRVARHYGARQPLQVGSRPQMAALLEAAREISRFSSLALMSTEALAYLYERALITKETRRVLGTHSTPTYLVDYIVGKLRPWIEKIEPSKRQVFEPACGHAAFLLSAMRLLNDLQSPEEISSVTRHEDLRSRLHGVEVDGFALEIARLSLTLADIPNRNGWDLQQADMFQGNLLDNKTQAASIILANPPFKNFDSSRRALLSAKANRSILLNSAAEMLWRIVTNMQHGAVFGIVVPQTILSNKNATPLRQLLAGDEFAIEEICLFPDQVFNISGAESAVIIGRRLRLKEFRPSALAYKRIREHEIEAFKDSYQSTLHEGVNYSRFSPERSWSFLVPELAEVWDFCKKYPKFEEFAKVGQGFQFRSKNDPLLPKDAITESERRFSGAAEGVKFSESLQTHELPEQVYFNLATEVIGISRHGTRIGCPQILLNYSRVSRTAWRLKAVIDSQGHPVMKTLLVIRPKRELPLEVLWGICNSPLANSYTYTHAPTWNTEAGIVRGMPVPDLLDNDLTPLVNAVRNYFAALAGNNQIFVLQPDSDKLKELHWRIDAEVLKLYDLPRELERKLLDMFSGVKRRGVPFEQTEYFPEEFTDPITLSELLAITYDWKATNERRMQLILKKTARTINAAEDAELEHLQFLTDARIELLAPLPIKGLEAIKADLQRQGLWEGH